MSAWLVILVGLGVAAGLVLLVLAVPVDLRLHWAAGERAKAEVRIEWLFGLVGKDLGGGRKKAKKSKPDEARGPNLRALWQSGLVGRGLALMKRLRRTVSIREVRVRALVNAGDPGDTGRAFALIGPMAGFLAALPRTDIVVGPDFGPEAGVRGDVRGWVRIVPILGLLPVLAFALSPGTWRGIKHVRRAGRA